MAEFNIDLTTVKQFLGYDEDDDSRNIQLQILLDSAMGTLRSLMGRRLDRGLYMDTFGSWGGRIYLREFPIESVVEIAVGGAVVDPTSYHVFSSGCILFYNRSGFCYNSGSYFLDSTNLLTVQYVAGYATLPGNMLMALYAGIQAAEAAYLQTSEFGGIVKRRMVQDVGSVDYLTPKDLNNSAMKDTMLAHLGAVLNGDPAIGTPELHESEYLGAAP